MSLTRLHDKIYSFKRRRQGSNTADMRSFLESANVQDAINVHEGLKFDEKESRGFLALFQSLRWTPGHQLRSDITNRSFTQGVALLFHDILRDSFKGMIDELRKIHDLPYVSKVEDIKEDSFVEYQKHLHQLWRFQIRLRYCADDLKGIMKHYLQAITKGVVPATPLRHEDENSGAESDNDDEDEDSNKIDPSWSDTYHAWIMRITRQARAAGQLSSGIKDPVKRRLLEVHFDLVETAAPDTNMEDWEKTLQISYMDFTSGQDYSEVLKALRTVVLNSSYHQDRSYEGMKSGKWETSFKGAIHCEAVIATRQCEGTSVSLSRISSFFFY